jgi:hypothetical protein
MERTGVQWTDSAGTETISMVSSPQVICPNWTILRKLNMNPFRTADEDTILEPGDHSMCLSAPRARFRPMIHSRSSSNLRAQGFSFR